MDRLPRLELEVLEGRLALADLDAEPTGQAGDRLLLALVELQRQRVTLADVDRLPRVLAGHMREQLLVPPRLVRALHGCDPVGLAHAALHAIPSRMSASLTRTSGRSSRSTSRRRISAPAPITSTRPGCITGSAARSACVMPSSSDVTFSTCYGDK